MKTTTVQEPDPTPPLSFKRSAQHALALFVAIFGAVLIIYVDMLVLEGTVGEYSAVQLAQAALILGSAILFGWGARHLPDQRAYLITVATLFLCMFIREQDGPLDFVYKGFWLVPVLLTAGVGAIAIFRTRATFRPAFHQHTRHPSFWIGLTGLFQLLVFSRLFGSGQLWHNIPEQPALRGAKPIVQECTELLCYALIFLGAALSHQARYGKNADEPRITQRRSKL